MSFSACAAFVASRCQSAPSTPAVSGVSGCFDRVPVTLSVTVEVRFPMTDFSLIQSCFGMLHGTPEADHVWAVACSTVITTYSQPRTQQDPLSRTRRVL